MNQGIPDNGARILFYPHTYYWRRTSKLSDVIKLSEAEHQQFLLICNQNKMPLRDKNSHW
uniref:Uncharacterized protein n=1 Tax=Candidatus Kentrum sp. TC TaxID=2126339 RepID=A0A451AET9_9GAMM|nr:MAG: hypothetical protein BECKTC1821E_GA0114239_10111 [Candidatus Kentron sp. TC]VFK51059.1 MAG: hypothetical protein BECKTC1821D_GA0114238_11308 [Candidatus Kentron sp. TC]VFK64560.1 MAG: hypothetical protein BECKTC1821F_GA0114240_11321 [Candidatus Kentron sp. TC]